MLQVPHQDLQEASEYLADALTIRGRYAELADHKVYLTTAKFMRMVSIS